MIHEHVCGKSDIEKGFRYPARHKNDTLTTIADINYVSTIRKRVRRFDLYAPC